MRKTVFIVLIVSLLLVILMFPLMLTSPQIQAPSDTGHLHHLQIIVDNADTYFYKQFLGGARESADFYKAYVEIVPLEQGKTDSLTEAVERGIYAHVDGIAFRADADMDIQRLCDIARGNGVQLALYESQSTMAPTPNIATNAYSIGTSAATLAIEATLGDCRAVLVLDKSDGDLSANRSLKLQGVLELFDGYPNAEIVGTHIVGSDFMATEQLMDMLFANKVLNFNIVICLVETSTPMFAQRILDNTLIGSVLLIGYGALPETLDYINREIIYGSVCPDAYEIGYQTVTELVTSLGSDIYGNYSSTTLYFINKQNVSEFILKQEEDIG